MPNCLRTWKTKPRKCIHDDSCDQQKKQIVPSQTELKELTYDINHDLTFYHAHNVIRSMFREPGTYIYMTLPYSSNQ